MSSDAYEGMQQILKSFDSQTQASSESPDSGGLRSECRFDGGGKRSIEDEEHVALPNDYGIAQVIGRSNATHHTDAEASVPKRKKRNAMGTEVEQLEIIQYRRQLQQENEIEDFQLEVEVEETENLSKESFLFSQGASITANTGVTHRLPANVSSDDAPRVGRITRSKSTSSVESSTLLRPGLLKRRNSLSKPEQIVEGPRPCILYLDSLGRSKPSALKLIKAYLEQEWLDKRGGVTSTHTEGQAAERFEALKMIRVKVPEQSNSCDCGLFMLKYIELFALHAAHLQPPLENLLHPQWNTYDELRFDKHTIIQMRRDISCLIKRLGKEQAISKPP